MQTEIRVAAVQMNACLNKRENLLRAERLVHHAASEGAQLVVLPELFSAYGWLAEVRQQAEPIPGPTSTQLSAWAANHGIYLCGGSLAEQADDPTKAYNTSLLFGPQGELLAKYRKIHLFDIDLAGVCQVRESDEILPGNSPVCFDTPLGSLGLAICYDLRFPELFRQLANCGMEILLFPSAFTATTGRAHWETLLRARAIENQAFVIAANQAGTHPGGLKSFGHSCVIDPWGNVLAAAAEEEETTVFATISGDSLRQVRQQLPALKNRRRDLWSPDNSIIRQ
jgi:predicted amidohydrolase